MMSPQRFPYWSVFVPLLIGVLVLPIPLIGNFHIESALLAALIGCFWSAWQATTSVRHSRQDWARITHMLQCIYLAGVPLAIYGLFCGCLSWNGLGFWVLYPLPSIFFGYAIGRLLRCWSIPKPRLVAIIILLVVAIGILLVEFFHLPQVYFFNHVWGGWAGPIYDESIQVGWNLVYFRGITVAWIMLLWWLPEVRLSMRAKGIVIVCLGLLGAAYMHLPELGIISPRSYLQQQLGGHMQTPHFEVYFAKGYYSNDEMNFIAEQQEFYYQQITDTLQLPRRRSSRIESYFYAHPWQKKQLVGAKFTSYVPIWLKQDQLHIAKQQIEGSLKHELVHVLAKQFGNSLFHGSWSMGLTEGLAVALAGGDSPVSTVNQIVAAEKPYPTARQLQHSFSPRGFYGGRSAVNYTQSGSFVQYLLRNFPVQDLRTAYRKGNIPAAYHHSMQILARGWHQQLNRVSIDSTDRRHANLLYSIPSLFEQPCPHVQSHFAALWDDINHAMAEQDTAYAISLLNKARKKIPHSLIKSRWAYLNLMTSHAKQVALHASSADTALTTILLDADALALRGRAKRAQKFLNLAGKRLSAHPDSLGRYALQLREQPRQWNGYRKIIYRRVSVSDQEFAHLATHTQARAMQEAIYHQRWQQLIQYATIGAKDHLNPLYFDIYLHAIRWTAFEGRPNLASEWILNLKSLSLRKRYLEQLHESERWIDFLEDYKYKIH